MKLKNKLSFIVISLLSTSQIFAGNIINTLPEETDAFSIEQADRKLLHVNASGTIGLGTNQPKVELHLKNNKVSNDLRIENSTNNFNFKVNSGHLTIGTTEICTEEESMGHQLTIDNDGKIGINTSNPLAELHISNAFKGTSTCDHEEEASTTPTPVSIILEGSSKWTITSQDDNSTSEVNNNKLSFKGKDNQEVLTLNNNGNVGVGQVNPLIKLDVNGGIKLSTATGCSSETVGTIQYDATADKFQGCRDNNGTAAWIDLHL